MFLLCTDKEYAKVLQAQGYTLQKEPKNEKEPFVFIINNNVKMQFDLSKCVITNRLHF